MKTWIGLIGMYLLCGACSDSSRTSVEAPSRFSLGFRAQAGSQSIHCDSEVLNLGTSAAKARLLDLRFFVHGLVFVKADGSETPAVLDKNDWQAENVALLDFQNKDDNCSGADKPTNVQISGSVANADGITGLRFQLGLPNDLNHADPARVSAPLNESSMFWSWQSGYKFLRLDLAPEGGISRPSDPDFLGTDYFFHLGSTDCSGNPVLGEKVSCTRVNQPEVVLKNSFVLNGSVVRFDVAAFLSQLDLKSDDHESPGCMSGLEDLECQSFFQKLGLDFDSGASSALTTQSVFSLE